MDIRLKTAKYTFDGQEMTLCCNMNVLADVQEMFDGNISKALRSATTKTIVCFLTAMINDYLDSEGSDKSYTVKQVGRLIPPSQLSGVTSPRGRRTHKFRVVSYGMGDTIRTE